jgi:hypothetical protein
MSTLPPTLDRFGAELENAARRDLGARRKRRWILRATVLSTVAAAIAVGLLSALPSGGPSVVQRAAAALQPAHDTILHFQLSAKQWNPDGTTVDWQSETWQLRVAPYTRRQIEVGFDGLRAESLTRGDLNELYDARNDTIYSATTQELATANMPKVTIVSKSELLKLTKHPRVTAAYLFYKSGSGKRPKVLATAEGARRLRAQMAKSAKQPTGVLPDEFRSEILPLLRSGRARETGRVDVAGHKAIRIESRDGKRVYVVDSKTYAPIEWTTTGDGGGVTLRYPVYEELAVDAESLKLLDLEAQHPGARVDRDVHDYQAAEARLFPHG